MNILYYIPHVSQAGGGARQYANTLLKIIAQDAENQYYVLHTNNDTEILHTIQQNRHLYLIPHNTAKEAKWEKMLNNIIKLINFINSREAGSGKSYNWSYLNRICKKYKIGVVYSPFQMVPHCNRKVIWTLHDLQELHFPAHFSPEIRATRARIGLDNIKRGFHIVVSYQHIKDDIIKYFEVTPQNITVCLLDMQNLWIERFTQNDIQHDFVRKYPTKFLLYPANTWVHKNHHGLIKCLLYIQEHYQEKITVICTGHLTDYYDKELMPLVIKNQLQNQLRFVGVVSEQELYSLYQACWGVVIPTKYEAGSFPLMESLLLHRPVICSNVTSLPDTIGDDSFVFSPFDMHDMAQKVIMLWRSEVFRQLSIENSHKQANELHSHRALTIIKTVIDSAKTIMLD